MRKVDSLSVSEPESRWRSRLRRQRQSDGPTDDERIHRWWSHKAGVVAGTTTTLDANLLNPWGLVTALGL
jgi:hypothetical protein